MATEPEESFQEKPIPLPIDSSSHLTETLEQQQPWIDYAIEQSGIYQKTIEDTFNSVLEASRSRLSEIRSVASAHLNQATDFLDDAKSNYASYEEFLLAKIKEGGSVAAAHPMITSGVAAGLVLTLKRMEARSWHNLKTRGQSLITLFSAGPRRFIYHKTLRLFVSQETLLSRADAKVKELEQSLRALKAETEKLHKNAADAEGVLIRGKNKLRQAGKQIQSEIGIGYKIEKQARGLKDLLRELPRSQASQLRKQVSELGTNAKQERIKLSKEGMANFVSQAM